MYLYHDRVKMSQTDKRRNLTIPAIIDAMQNCVMFQLEDLGVGLDYMDQENKMLVVTCWQVQIFSLPRLFDSISLATQAYAFKAATGFRNCMIYDKDGKLCVASNSIGVFVDATTGRPIKTTAEEWGKYDIKKGLELEFKDRHIPIPTEYEIVEQFQVNIHHLDTNNHMNNAQYVRIAYNYLPENFDVSDFRVEYKKAAKLGDMVFVHFSAFTENSNMAFPSEVICISLCDETGSAYAAVEFTRKKICL